MKTKLTRKTTVKSILGLILLASSQAHASLVDFSVSGQIVAAATGNSWGLSIGNTFTASGQFDDSAISTGIIDFTSATNNMNITFGNTVYTDDMDVFGGANMYFTASGIFDGIDYLSILNPEFRSTGFAGGPTDVYGTVSQELELYVDGTWNVDSYVQTSAVPIPAAIWLFGSGLIGLVGIGRRKL